MLIVAIIAGIFVPIFLVFYSQNKPRIRFTLSDQLRIGQAKDEKIWQLITVRNSGKVVSKNIQLKIQSKIVNYQISKNSEADKPNVFDTSDSFELLYPELPVGGSFELTFATDKKYQIGLEDISVSHSTGEGAEAFSESNFKSLLSNLPIIFGGIIYLIIGFLMLAWASLDNNASMYPVEKVLKKTKPFYITHNKWLDCRQNAIKKVVSLDSPWKDIILLKSYQILDDEPPSYLSKEEWKNLTAEAISKIQDSFKEHIGQAAYYTEQFLPILRIKQPKNMPDTIWSKIQQEVNNTYFKMMTSKASFSSMESLQQLLTEEKPEEVHSKTWQKYLSEVKDIYFEKIEKELEYSNEPYIFIEQQNLKVLSSNKAGKLKEKAYRLQLKLLPDLQAINNAKAFLENPKPEWLKEEDYSRCKEMAANTISAKNTEEEYKEKLSSVKAREKELSTKIQKVTSQLEIINQAINEPNALERIEEHSNSFAPGNFENLKKIATLNKQLKDASKK